MLLKVFLFICVLSLINATKEDKIIVDVDPGIDDIEALVLLLNQHAQGRLEILAIIITDGNTQQTYGIKNTFRLLQAANQLKIPVYEGSFSPIMPHTINLHDEFFGKDGFGDLPWSTEPPTNLLKSTLAPKLIHDLITRHPNEITYIVLGPMTNLALAMRMYEAVASGIKQIYAMGGMQHDESAEFNIRYDAESADIVFSMLATPMHLLTMEACRKNAPGRVWFENATIANPVFNMVLAAEQSLKANQPTSPQWTSCDAITIIAYLQEGCIQQQVNIPLKVDLNGETTRGIVDEYYNEEFPRRGVNVIMEIDYVQAQEMFLTAMQEICHVNNCQNVE